MSSWNVAPPLLGGFRLSTRLVNSSRVLPSGLLIAVIARELLVSAWNELVQHEAGGQLPERDEMFVEVVLVVCLEMLGSGLEGVDWLQDQRIN